MERKILLVSVNDRSYSSYRYFAKRLAEALEKQGCRIGWCHVSPDAGQDMQAWSAALSQAQAFHADAVVDFNSFLPKMVVGGRSLPELFEAPFYNYVLDHPLYHKRALEAELPDCRCICVDGTHEVYIRKNYPKMQSVFTHPLPGSLGVNAEHVFENRIDRILFCGTYEEPERYLQLMKDLPEAQRRACMELVERILDCPDQSMDSSVTPENAGYLFLADAYVRHARRKRILQTLIQEGFSIDLYGNGWEALKPVDMANPDVRIYPSIMYSDYVNKLGTYQIALNIMPGFVEGSHDRITCAMRNRAAVLTDENVYVREHYRSSVQAGTERNADSNVVAAFPVNDMQALCAACERMSRDKAWLQQLSKQGKSYGEANHTWEALAERILTDLSGRLELGKKA